jgi:hypothetical protein
MYAASVTTIIGLLVLDAIALHVASVWSFHTGSIHRAQHQQSLRFGSAKRTPQSVSLIAKPFVSKKTTTTTATTATATLAATRAVNGRTIPSTTAAVASTNSKGGTAADEPLLVDAAICGGGPAGLLTAIMLAQQKNGDGRLRFSKIHVYDRLSAPPRPDDETVWNQVARFYLIGLGGRGQAALKQFGVWDDVMERCTAVLGRCDWSPENPNEPVERIFKDRRTTTQVLPRDKLVGVLHEHIQEHYSSQITLFYGKQVQPIDFERSAAQ